MTRKNVYAAFTCEFLILHMSFAQGGRICDVDIVRPKWYEPEYESVSVSVRVSTVTKLIINGEETLSPEGDLNVYVPTYGNSGTPPEPHSHQIQVSRSEVCLWVRL